MTNKKSFEIWTQCTQCYNVIYTKILMRDLKICPACNYAMRLSSNERIQLLVDHQDGQVLFDEFDENMQAVDFLDFYANFDEYKVNQDQHKTFYHKKIDDAKIKSGLQDCVRYGKAKIGVCDAILVVFDFNFMGGSMGSVAGEKVTRAIELAMQEKCPLVIVSSSGGARMQEGIFSLMQMVKTSATLAKLYEKKIFYLSVLCDPTMGGVLASFAMLGDVIIAEEDALIGFAGPRVIRETIQESLPHRFQKADFLKECGFIDRIVSRSNMKKEIEELLKFFS